MSTPQETSALFGEGANITFTADDVAAALDTTWLLLCGMLVMFMQTGFAFVESGNCRSKNIQYILLKNVIDMCVGTVGWWSCGWAFAYGGPHNEKGELENHIIGTRQFFGSTFLKEDSQGNLDGGVIARGPLPSLETFWFFQWAFCTVGATIVSGGVAERVNIAGYVLYSLLMTAFIYPVVVAWTWGGGWLKTINDVGYYDFAGSGVVHLTGGIGALIGAWLAGPREGRWWLINLEAEGRWNRDLGPNDFSPHNMSYVVLGTMILWFGWYGFNCGSTLAMHNAMNAAQASHIAMNTTIAGAVGGLTVGILRLGIRKKFDLRGFCNGILGGLVSITAACANVESGSAFIIALVGGVLCAFSSELVMKLRIDDPVDAFAVHGACGCWGVLSAALFDWGQGFDYVHGAGGFSCKKAAGSSTCISGLWSQQLAANAVGIVVISTWSGCCSLAVFSTFKRFGFLIVPSLEQDSGLDQAECEPGRGYDFSKEVIEKTMYSLKMGPAGPTTTGRPSLTYHSECVVESIDDKHPRSKEKPAEHNGNNGRDHSEAAVMIGNGTPAVHVARNSGSMLREGADDSESGMLPGSPSLS